MDVIARANRLRDLHAPGARPLVLANIWDAASARIVEEAGYPAIATGSAGVAFSLGYADGQHVPMREMIDAIARIVRVVTVPVTADIEAGYGNIQETANALLAAGAAGMNLEDFEDGHLVPLDEQLARIRTARATGLVVNARTDIYLAAIGDPGTRCDRTIERIRAFAAAGADCVFVPGVTDEATIARLVQSVDAPLNILGAAGAPPVSRLKQLGVGRVSVGSGPMRATMSLMRTIAEELRDAGTYNAIAASTISYAAANNLFKHNS